MDAAQVAMMISKTADNLPARVLSKAAVISAQRVRTAVVKTTPVDQGEVRNAWKVIIGTSPGEPVRVENLAPHAGIIERGARPHGVNKEGILALTEWVIRKGIAQVEIGPGRGKQGPARLVSVNVRRFNKRDDAAAAVNAIVWGIVKKLKEEGQKGYFMLERLVPYASFWMEQEIPRLLQEELAPKQGPGY